MKIREVKRILAVTAAASMLTLTNLPYVAYAANDSIDMGNDISENSDPAEQSKPLQQSSNASSSSSTEVSNAESSSSTEVSNAESSSSTEVSNASNSSNTEVSNAESSSSTEVSNASNSSSTEVSGASSSSSTEVSNASSSSSTEVSNAESSSSTEVSNAESSSSTEVSSASNSSSTEVSNASNSSSTEVSNASNSSSTEVSSASNSSSTEVSNASNSSSTEVSSASNSSSTEVSSAQNEELQPQLPEAQKEGNTSTNLLINDGTERLPNQDMYDLSKGGADEGYSAASLLGESKIATDNGGNQEINIDLLNDGENNDSSENHTISAYDKSDDINATVQSIGAEVDGDTIVISYTTRETNPWDHNYSKQDIVITLADGTQKKITIDYNGNIHGDNWSDIAGASIEQASYGADTGTSTIRIPASWFNGTTDFTISSGGLSATMTEGGSPITNGSASSSDGSEAVYTGISVDGDFSDWDAVSKTDLLEPEGEKCVESVAWRIEGDAVYLYIKDSGTNSATWAGPNHNGKFAITTDLGRTLVLQLNEDGMVTGVEGIESVHNGSQWEIRIPAEMLPQNNGGLNFGLYLTDPTLSGFADTGNTESSTGIAYDGVYGDWDSYPHEEIQYATAGTQENVPDGEAAIYVDNNVYGHCVTQMQAHLDERGQEFSEGVTVSVNRRADDEYGWYSEDLHMRLVSVDANGNINWNPQRTGLDNGSYEYYIFDTGCWGSSQNINDLVEADVCYGKATIQILDGRQDMEWYVDSAKLAARYGIDETDMKTVSSQYIRIGTQWVNQAGTSSGPVPGAAMCLATAAIPFLKKKKFSLGTLLDA